MYVSTVYLTENAAPNGFNFVQGYVEVCDTSGVLLNTQPDGHGKRSFYPIRLVQRIDYDTGWATT